MTRIISLTSSGDGVGVTGIAINLAARLANAGRRVCLLELVADATAASARLDVAALSTLSDRLTGAAAAVTPVVALPAGFDLVAGGTEKDWFWNLSTTQLAALTAELELLDDYDFVLLDAGAGTAQNQLAFSLAGPELWLIVTPEPTSLSAAYTRLKLLYAEGYAGKISVVVNKSENHTVGRHSYNKFREIAGFYLDMEIPLAGILSEVHDVALTGIVPGDDAEHSTIAAEFSGLIDYLFSRDKEMPQLDMVTYGQRYLQAAGGVDEVESTRTETPAFSVQPSGDGLQQQLDLLSGQVDELIAEIDRLRKGDSAAALIPLPAVSNQRGEEGCNRACIAAMASHTEQVTAQGDTFALYYLRRASGAAQRFAFHSVDDDLEEPEPQTQLP